MIETYQAGASAEHVAKEFGLSKGAVIQLLTDAGLIRKRNSPTEAQLLEATRLYVEESWSLERIGAELGFRNTTIHRHFKLRGVPMRRPWEHLR
ncbi:MAG TPA: hypothetical protein VHE33_09840 [Acidobacteriaceae bacterium]|nr:hypothetical protein [Acidobacteriaceae bacterium]